MENRIYFTFNQDDVEAQLLFNMGKDEIIDYCKPAQEKIHEEDPEEIALAKGTRHPSTRGERRKKTAHAKNRHTETLRTRELRKYPYSLMLGKGKKHDKVWIDEPAWVEIRTLSRMDGRERDFLLF